MAEKRNTPASVDEYIADFPPSVQKRLRAIRKAIRAALPDAQEKISYGIPTFRLKKNVIHFAAFANHIGVYPAPRTHVDFRDELASYRGGKGTVQFPHQEPLPIELIVRIARFRASAD